MNLDYIYYSLKIEKNYFIFYLLFLWYLPIVTIVFVTCLVLDILIGY